MDKLKLSKNIDFCSKSDYLKVKEELRFNENQNLPLLEVEISNSVVSYGEVFITGNQFENEGEPFTWWITCNVCKHSFNSFDLFLNHAINTHLNINKIAYFKAELDNDYNEKLDINTEKLVGNDYHSLKTKITKTGSKIDNKNYTEGFFQDVEKSDIKVQNKEKSSLENQNKSSLLQDYVKCRTFKKPLRRHLNVHLKLDNKVYECKICHETFSNEQKRLYRNHRDRAHKEKIPCSLCEKTFRSKYYLDAHMKTHSGIKEFICSECPAAFYSKTSLSEHVRKTHLTPKVACRFCNKLFRAQGIQIHERIHTGEKPFVCEQCGTAFQRNSLLQNHIKRHNNDRRYECDVCGKKFYNHTYLRDHKITHTDEKPYECLTCNARFNSGPALRKHKNLHLEIKKYHCKICGKAYAQGSGLYAHMKSHNIAEDIHMKSHNVIEDNLNITEGEA